MEFEIEFADGQIRAVEDYLVVTLDGIEYAICSLESPGDEVRLKAYYVRKDEKGMDMLVEITNVKHAMRLWEWMIAEEEAFCEEERTVSKEEDFVFVRSEFGFTGEEEVLVEYKGDAEVILVPEKTDSFGAAGATKSLFAHPERVKQVVLNSNLKSIGDYAFCGCHQLEELTIPENVTSLWYSCPSEEESGDEWGEWECSHIFQGCTSLKKVIFQPGAWEIQDICDGLFQNCVSLKQVELPGTIQWIGKSMFEGCTSLEEITLPESVSVIGPYAFKNCKKLKKVRLPGHPLAIHPTAFSGTQFHPPVNYTRRFDVNRCSVCGGKINIGSRCKQCGRHICYCGKKSEWKY